MPATTASRNSVWCVGSCRKGTSAVPIFRCRHSLCNLWRLARKTGWRVLVVDSALGRHARAILEFARRPVGWVESRINSSRELAAALAASELRYRHLVENAPDIIY